VDARGDDGHTPLHEAALRGHKEVVVLLLSQGADPKATNPRGHTPLDFARSRHPELLPLLEQPTRDQ